MTTRGVEVQPITNDDNTVQVEAELSGYLLARDAAAVTFTIGNLQYQLERDFLKPEDFVVDALCNADGVALECEDLEPECADLLVPEVRDGCFTGQMKLGRMLSRRHSWLRWNARRLSIQFQINRYSGELCGRTTKS